MDGAGAARKRALAAAVTPLTTEGGGPDVAGIGNLVEFYARTELDGLLALGTTGEGVLLSLEERRTAAAAFVEASHRRVQVYVHCGAQTTRDTVALAEHAAGAGADGIAVIAPPYYALDDDSILGHFIAAADACAPTPFYVYEFAARSGYAVPIPVLQALRERAANFTGIKVSDAPFDAVRPYILPGLDVLIGAEQLIHHGLQAGATGAVSGLAAAFPEVTVRAVRSGFVEDSAAAAEVRMQLQRFPFQAALKHVLLRRGVHIGPDVRAPLRGLTAEESRRLDEWLATQSTTVSTASVAS